LSTVWTGAFNELAVREIIGAPPAVLPISMLPIGYSAEEPPLTSRRSLDDLVHYET
jgi:nitroreductase